MDLKYFDITISLLRDFRAVLCAPDLELAVDRLCRATLPSSLSPTRDQVVGREVAEIDAWSWKSSTLPKIDGFRDAEQVLRRLQAKQAKPEEVDMHKLVCLLYGHTLRYLRADRNLGDMAKRADISARSWRDWEKGRKQPRPAQLSKAIKALDSSAEEFERVFLLGANLFEQRRRSAGLVPRIINSKRKTEAG